MRSTIVMILREFDTIREFPIIRQYGGIHLTQQWQATGNKRDGAEQNKDV